MATATTSVDASLAADDAVSATGGDVGAGTAVRRLRDARRRRHHDLGVYRGQPAPLTSVSVWLDFVAVDRRHRDVAFARDRAAVARHTGALLHLLRRRVAAASGQTCVVLRRRRLNLRMGCWWIRTDLRRIGGAARLAC